MKEQVRSSQFQTTRSNFGAWGWFTILFAFFSFMFAGNLIVDGMNITVSAFAQLRGWQSGVLLSYSTVAGLISIVGCVVLSNCVSRYGVKIVYCISLAIVALCCMVWGAVTQLWQYVLILILVNIFGNGFGFVGGTAILSNWFPRKKGLAMGWATIGFQASPVLMLPTFSWVMHRFNLRIAYQTVGACLLVMLLVCIFLVKSDPEEHGCAPDNDWTHTLEEFKALHEKAVAYEKSHHLTTAQLLKTKQMWQIGVVNGLVQMAITVLIVQFIPNMIACGFSASTSTAIYSIASILGGVGSYLWGLLDQKVGVKKATVWMCLMHAIAGAAFAVAAGHLIEGAGGAPVRRLYRWLHPRRLLQLRWLLHRHRLWPLRLRPCLRAGLHGSLRPALCRLCPHRCGPDRHRQLHTLLLDRRHPEPAGAGADLPH